jgi:hypothetical protein
MVGASHDRNKPVEAISSNRTDLRSGLRAGLSSGLWAGLRADFGSCRLVLVLVCLDDLGLEVSWGLGSLEALDVLCPCPCLCPCVEARCIAGGHPVQLDHRTGFLSLLSFLTLLFLRKGLYFRPAKKFLEFFEHSFFILCTIRIQHDGVGCRALLIFFFLQFLCICLCL